MTQDSVVAFRAPDGFSPDPLTNLLRQGARDLIAHAAETDGHGRRVRHGHLPGRDIQTGTRAVPVKVSRLRDCACEKRLGSPPPLTPSHN